MRNVDVLWSKFLVQALAQASLGEFRGREDAGGRIAPQSGGGTREDQRSLLACTLARMFYRIGQLILLECCYRSSRERKGTDYSGSGGTFDLFIGQVEEPLEHALPCIIDCYANLRGRKLRIDGGECGLDIRGSIALDWEGLSLRRTSDAGDKPMGKISET